MEIMFSPCLWRKISRVQVHPGKEGAGALTLWLEGGIGLTVFPWEDFCEACWIDEQRTPLKLKVRQLHRALYNWEDLHEDQVTGFSASTSTIFFNQKGQEQVGNPHVCFIPEGTDSVMSIHEDDFTGLAWALSMVMGEQYDIYGEDLELSFHQWNQFLKEAEKILAYTSYRKLYKHLMTLKKKGSREPVLKWYVDNCGQEYWENREAFRKQINDLKIWSEEILKPDGKMVVMGS